MIICKEMVSTAKMAHKGGHMGKKRLCTVLLFFGLWMLFFPLTSIEGKETRKTKNVIDRETPIQITSNRMNAYDEKGVVVFEGNAIAKQGERTIHAETISLHYKKKKDAAVKKNIEDIQKGGDLERIEARGNVRMTQGDRVVTGNEAIYLHEEQKIIVKGNATLKEGKNVVKGNQVVVFLDENRGVVEGNKAGQVNAIIYPSEKKETTH